MKSYRPLTFYKDKDIHSISCYWLYFILKRSTIISNLLIKVLEQNEEENVLHV